VLVARVLLAQFDGRGNPGERSSDEMLSVLRSDGENLNTVEGSYLRRTPRRSLPAVSDESSLGVWSEGDIIVVIDRRSRTRYPVPSRG
jgi:hypothetical protein